MFKRISTAAIGMLTMFAMLTPAFALANNNHNGNDDSNRRYTTNQYGVHVFDNTSMFNNEDKNKNDDRNNDKNKKDKENRKGINIKKDFRGFFPSLFYRGTVTAVSTSSFTMTTKDGQVYTVQTGSAKIVRIPNTVITNSDIAVGDTVNITGTKANEDSVVITASVVYDLSKDLKPAMAKGTVTATASNSLTVQSNVAGSLPIDVNTTADTKVVNADHTTGSLADIETGAKVKLIGFWDSVLNVFNAIKIKLF